MGFLGEFFESAAADKWPEVTRRITWSWLSIGKRRLMCTKGYPDFWQHLIAF